MVSDGCFRRGVNGSPVRASHTRAVLSWLAVAIHLPSGLHEAWFTAIEWRICGVNGSPVTAFQRRAVPSSLAVTTERPSELNAA
jgi:hypothetical protein